MDNYPTLRLGVLQGLQSLKAAFDADPKYLRRRECPYDDDTRDILEKLFEPKTVEVIKEVEVSKPERGQVGRPSTKSELSDEDAVELETEAKQMLQDLRNLDKTAEGELKALDTQTRLTIIKTKTTLLEKLLSIRERFTGARKVIDFQKFVIGVLDDLVEEEKRDEFIRRLEAHKEQ